MIKFQKEIEKQITNIAREVTEEIENISAKIESKIQEIEDRIRQSFTTLTWGLLIGDSIVSALFSGLATWWVVRRLEKDIEKRLTRLNEVLAGETLDNIQELTDEIKKLRARGESNPNIS